MPAHDKAFARKDAQIRAALERGDMAAVDHYLEQRHDMATRATNWDADKWGLAPDDPMWDAFGDTRAT